jgi:hypothetical protein
MPLEVLCIQKIELFSTKAKLANIFLTKNQAVVGKKYYCSFVVAHWQIDA